MRFDLVLTILRNRLVGIRCCARSTPGHRRPARGVSWRPAAPPRRARCRACVGIRRTPSWHRSVWVGWGGRVAWKWPG